MTAGIAVVAPPTAEAVLHVTASISFAQLWLAPRLRHFQRDHPGLGLRIVSALWSDDYLHARADVEIRYGAKDMVGGEAELLVEDVVIALCAPRRLKALKTWETTCTEPLIHTIGTSDTWQSWADHLNLTPPPAVSHSVDSYVLSTELARCGTGVALGSRFLCHQLIMSGDIGVPLDLCAPAKDNHYITVNVGSPLRRNAETFRDWIFSEIES